MANVPQVGQGAPDFTLESTQGLIRGSDIWKGGKAIIAFYTEDSTPACESEVMAFAEDLPLLAELGVKIVAVSSDSLDSHQRFSDKVGGVPYPLACDEDLAVSRQYGVADETIKRSRRAVFVVEDGVVIFANPWYNPASPDQRVAVYQALGLDL